MAKNPNITTISWDMGMWPPSTQVLGLVILDLAERVVVPGTPRGVRFPGWSLSHRNRDLSRSMYVCVYIYNYIYTYVCVLCVYDVYIDM